MAAEHKLLVLPGDGIGPEVIAEARKVIDELTASHGLDVDVEERPVGGSAYDAHGDPLPDDTLLQAKSADAVLLGAVGGPQWETLERSLRPEKGLLRLRSELGVFANLRPIFLYPQLANASSLRADVIDGLDVMIVRELTGGIYFGEPRGIRTLESGEQEGYNTLVYRESEIERIGRIAFDTAMRRGRRLCHVDKANVLEVSELWRAVLERLAAEFPQVELSHMYVDNAAMQMVRAPTQFDVIVTTNMFGDILSDLASMLTGSIGMLPSASLNQSGRGLYEPIHGSAPDIAGQDKANPLAAILSVAMLLRYSFKKEHLAAKVESAVARVLADGYRTVDLARNGETPVGTREMGSAVAARLEDTNT